MAGRDERRVELGKFLRDRRERFVCEDASGPPAGRRRASGLSREEVAAQAGISVDWYTKIEQGRAKNPSEQVLLAIARALRLPPHETTYALDLTRRATTPDSVAEEVSLTVRWILDTVEPAPAFVVGRTWDLLAWNRAAVCVFGDFDRMPPDRRNLALLLFTSGAAQQLVVDWDVRARDLVADLRTGWAQHPSGDGSVGLIGRLSQGSQEFRRWWEARVVARLGGGRRELDHPIVGRLAFDLLILGVEGGSGPRILVYRPSPDADTPAKLGRLLDHPDVPLPPVTFHSVS